ncbi:hypothetical protein [Streptomyces sp. NPDC050759]|uniref:hypothetical protein n=1 Tax=Streptomyces sp. NPDC050759 TaxID=3365635 RepID=UPI0037926B38
MSAYELVVPDPYVSTDYATDATLLPAEHKPPALLIVNRDDQPYAVVPTVAMGVPPSERLPRRRFRRPTVGPDVGIMHIAALMARTHTPLVTLVGHDSDRTWPAGAVTAARLPERLIGGS